MGDSPLRAQLNRGKKGTISENETTCKERSLHQLSAAPCMQYQTVIEACTLPYFKTSSCTAADWNSGQLKSRFR